MKIAYIIPSLSNKGPIVVVNNLVRFLKDKVEQIDVFYFDSLPAMSFACSTYQIKMNEAINFDNYDIVHSHCFRPDKYVYKWRSSIHKAKIVTTLHQDTYESFRLQYNSLFAYLSTYYWCCMQRQFDGVIAISNQLKSSYNLRLNSKITTIYNGCFINIDHSNIIIENVDVIKLYVDRGYRILGTYAYVTKRKGLLQLIRVLPHLKEYVLVIIGEGPDIERLKQMSKALDVADRVAFLPYMDAPYNYLQFFDVYTMTSYSEGFGLAMVEAALAEKAIVCSNIPSFHEIFTEEEACFFELDNQSSLIQAIELAYKQRIQRGKLAFDKTIAKFTATKMAENYLLYYESIL